MGIARFGARMREYATHRIYDKNTPLEDQSYAVIDGPGLAHHIYRQLISDKVTASGVSYEQCADGVIAWLDELRSFGFIIQAVIFDGALPKSKKQTRLERLQAYIDRLAAYRKDTERPLLASRSLPPPAFLVFAVVEGLLQSRAYSDVTYIVPGEADPYCVLAASDRASAESTTIFSDDADLLVYEVPERTRIVAFRDTELDINEHKDRLRIAEIWPADILRKAPTPLRSLIYPAFYMAYDPHLALDKAFYRVAAEDPTKHKGLLGFAPLFETGKEIPIWTALRHDLALRSKCAGRDSRVSELICQLEERKRSGVGGFPMLMFLPFLIDDPSRGNPWLVGHEMRSLAYSIFLRYADCNAVVHEYKRSDNEVRFTAVRLLSRDEILDQLTELTAHFCNLQTWASEHTSLDAIEIWRYLAIQCTFKHYEAQGLSLPHAADVIDTLLNRFSESWPRIHLSAQYQAAFYSFRILQQALAYTHTSLDTTQLPVVTLKAHELLKRLPSISRFFDTAITTPAQESHWQDLVQDLLQNSSGRKEPEEEGEEESRESRPRKKRKKSNKPPKNEPKPSVQCNALSKNPFAMLAE